MNQTSITDLALTLDVSGVIVQAKTTESTAHVQISGLVGRQWQDTVDDVSAAKVSRLLADARVHGFGGFGQINQLMPDGRGQLMEFSAIRLSPDATEIVVIGKDMTGVAAMQQRLSDATHTMEREFWRLRNIETRYQSVLELDQSPVIVVQQSDLRIVEANTPGLKLLDQQTDASPETGRSLSLSKEDETKLGQAFTQNQTFGATPAMVLRIGSSERRWIVRATQLEVRQGDYWMLRFEGTASSVETSILPSGTLEDFLENIQAPIAVTDNKGVVSFVNTTFENWARKAAIGNSHIDDADLIGSNIEHWVSEPQRYATSAIRTRGLEHRMLVMVL